MEYIIKNINNLIFENEDLIIIFDNNVFWFFVDEIANILGYTKTSTCIKHINQHVNKKYIKTYMELQKPSNIISKKSIILQNSSMFISKAGIYHLMIISGITNII